MEKDIINNETISFDSFCNIFKKYLGISHEQFAAEMNREELEDLRIERTSRAYELWRKNNKYHPLFNQEYQQIYKLFEILCKKKEKDPKEILIEGFRLPDSCRQKTLTELEEIITVKLDEKYNSASKQNIRPRKKFGTGDLAKAKMFFEECLSQKKKIKTIKMSFQSGWNWLKTFEDGYMFLKSLDNLGIPIHILVNDKEGADIISASMTNPEKKEFYFTLDEGIEKWNENISKLKNFHLHISKLPILRKIYIVEYENNDIDALVRQYAYNLYTDYENISIHLDRSDTYINFYNNEFNFLRDKAMKYSDWRKQHFQSKDEISPGKYLFLYPANFSRSGAAPRDKFCISRLDIKEQNTAELYWNLNPLNRGNLTIGTPECIYSGTVETTRNNIFFTLHNTEEEQICIMLRRPFFYDTQELYIGLITKLDATGCPVSFKCACTKKEALENEDWNKFKEFLKGDTTGSSAHMLELDYISASKFYSSWKSRT